TSLYVVTVSDTSTTPAAYDTSIVGTLRGALDWANASSNVTVPKGTPNVVRFDTTGTFATPQTITASMSGLVLTNLSVPESIVGTGVPPVNTTNPITVSGAGDGGHFFSIFSVAYLATASISGITITGGNAGSGFGGAVFSHGTLTLTNVIASNNTAAQGGAIDNNAAASLTITNSTISGNTGLGAAIMNIGTAAFPATTIINDSTISGNTEVNGFGTITNYPYLAGGIAKVTINNSTISGNTGGTDAVESDAGAGAVLTLNNTTIA